MTNEATRRLSHEIRRLIEIVRTAAATDDDADAAARAVRRIADQLEPSVIDGIRMQAALVIEPEQDVRGRSDFGMDLAGRDPDSLFPYSPVIGQLNPVAPPCRLWCVPGDPHHSVEGEVILGAAFAGPPDSIHGGFISSILDEALGGACGVNGLGGFTGTLTIRYLAPAPIHEALTVAARVTGTDGRKVFAAGELRQGQKVLAEATGVFIQAAVAAPG